jgi:hypothetical protein
MITSLPVTKIPAAQLNPAKYNPRVDLQPGDPAYENLLRSVEEFGYIQHIIWNQRTGNIVGGHQRFKVLQQLGYTEIDCVVVDLDEAREKAMNIALNKITGDWDMPKLVASLEDIKAYGLNFEITGFQQTDIDELYKAMKKKDGAVVEDDFNAEAEAESIAEPISQPGDIWLLGQHRLLCGDSTDPAQLAKLMAGAKACLCFTDPPWNVCGQAVNASSRVVHNDERQNVQRGLLRLPAFGVQSDGLRQRARRDDLCGDERAGVGRGDGGHARGGIPLVVDNHLGEGQFSAFTQGLPHAVRADLVRLAEPPHEGCGFRGEPRQRCGAPLPTGRPSAERFVANPPPEKI